MVKKDVISKTETNIVDGKKQEIVKEGKLDAQEKVLYKTMVNDIKKNRELYNSDKEVDTLECRLSLLIPRIMQYFTARRFRQSVIYSLCPESQQSFNTLVVTMLSKHVVFGTTTGWEI